MAEKKPKNFGQFRSASPNNTAEIIMQVKGHLMYRDSAAQMSAVTWMRNELTIASDKVRERLVDALIASDVVFVLCEVLVSSNSEIFTLILEILDKITFSVKFYTSNLAEKAVRSIFRIAYFMMKAPKRHADTLSALTYTVCAILDRAAAIDCSISEICDLDNVVLFLKDLKPSSSSNYILPRYAAVLLCIVIDRIDLRCNEKTQRALLAAFHDSVLSVSAIINKLKDCNDPLLQRFVGIACSICAAGTRFCNDDVVETASTAKGIGGAAFAKAISRMMVETVIPLFAAIQFEREDFTANVTHIIECLERLMQLKCCDTDELTNSLVTNGYLKSLLEVSFSSRVRDSMSFVLSELITNLSRDSLPIEDRTESRIQFRNYIYVGIEALPTKMDDFDLVLVHDRIASDVLAILMYHHFRGTAEHSWFSLSTVIPRLLFVTEKKPIVVLKAVWLLFAVSSLKHSEAQSASFCSEAAEHLAFLLANNEPANCYTHHPAIVQHGLVCEGFPVELQCGIIRLWLDFDGDTGTLLKTDKLELITDCLVSIVETSSEKFVKRALECIKELKSEKRCRDRIDAVVWEASSRVLDSFSIIGQIANAKGILQLFEETKLENYDEIDGESAIALVNTLMKEDVDEEFKILLVNHVHKLLDVSSARNNTKVVEVCLNDPELARTLRDGGFSRQNFRLSVACWDLLAFIVECQAKFELECNYLAIVRVEPLKMLVLLAITAYKLFSAAMRLLLALLNSENVIVEPIVSLNDFKDDAAAERAVFAWYRQLHLLHSKILSEDWDLVYRCLIAVLRFCHRKKFAKLLSGLCDYSGNYFLVSWTITRKYSGAIFFDFVDTWIRYAIEYRAPNWVQSVTATVPGTKEKSLGPTQFDKTLAMLREYRLKESY